MRTRKQAKICATGLFPVFPAGILTS
jgi:hypothetical protein